MFEYSYEIPKKLGYFLLKQEEYTDVTIKPRMESVIAQIEEQDLLQELIEEDATPHDVVSGWNTVIYYEWMAPDTEGASLFINVELRNPSEPTYYLVVYNEYNGHVEEYDKYLVQYSEYGGDFGGLLSDMEALLEIHERDFTEVDAEVKKKGY